MNRQSLIHDLSQFAHQAANASDRVLEAVQLIGLMPHHANVKAVEGATRTLELLMSLGIGLQDLVTRLEAVDDFDISNCGENRDNALEPIRLLASVRSSPHGSPSAHGGRELVSRAAAVAIGGENGSVAAGDADSCRHTAAQTDQAAGTVPGPSRAVPTRSAQHEAILERYADLGESNGELAAHFTMPRVEVAKAIKEAREHGDPRAEAGDRTRSDRLCSGEAVVPLTSKRTGSA